MCFFKIAATVIFLSVVFILPADAQDNEGYQAMAKALRNVIQENFDGYKEEDIAKIMTTVHTQSPGYLATKQISNEIFPPYELNYELINFKYLVRDGDYALARIKQKTSKIAGPAFKNNIIDAVAVFRQEDGQWKFWSQVILEIDYIN